MRSIAIIAVSLFLLAACTGSRKYFKAAEKLEKQGLMDEAAAYYLEALQRKPTNVSARIKVKEVGQKHVSALSSEFFRRYNTQDLEGAMETFERLKKFHGTASALNVQLDYPKTYEEDYQKSVEQYCHKNHAQAALMVNQKKYRDALTYIERVRKYNATYHNIQQLDVVANCEPLYQNAISALEIKNYQNALGYLAGIKSRTESYKDYQDLYELASAQQSRSFILFEPRNSNRAEHELEEALYSNFSQSALQKLQVRIINNTPFQNSPSATDLNNSTNIDLIQAIRKATGADYFYVFDVVNRNDYNPGVAKTTNRGFQEVKTRKNDTLVVTEYKPLDYNVVKGQRAFSYDFKYRIINAYNNQVVSSQTQNIRAQDAVEYNEFQKTFTGNINVLYPYNPQQTAPLMQYNPRNWRGLFSARSNLKSFEDLKNEAVTQNLNIFINSASIMR